MASLAHDGGPHILAGRSLFTLDHGPRFGIWFSIASGAHGVRITIGDGADGEARIIESDHPATVAFILSLILQTRGVAA